VDILRHPRVSQGRGDDHMNWMARPELREKNHCHTSSYLQIRETKQEDQAYNSMCAPLVAPPPINERRLCSEWDGATSAAKTMRRTRASPRSRAVEVRGRNYALARILSRCQILYEYTRENIAYSMETSPQVRAHVINRLLSTVRNCSCKYGMPVTGSKS
jgi:hypothetical protein